VEFELEFDVEDVVEEFEFEPDMINGLGVGVELVADRSARTGREALGAGGGKEA